MLVNVGKCSKRMSSSSQLGTLIGAVGGVCALGVESSPDMVIVSPSSQKGMLSASYALGVGRDGGIDIGEALAASLEDKPFLPILCFFDEDPNSMASFSRFYFRSRNSARKLTVISYFSFLIIGGTIGSGVSHNLVCSIPNVSSCSITVS